MTKTIRPQRSMADLAAELQQQIESLILLEPDLSVAQLAQQAVQEAEPGLLAELSAHLVVSFALKLARAERSKQSREQRPQMFLPGFEHLPQRIAVADKKRMPLEKATYSDLRAYIRRLTNLHRDRMKQDPKLTEARMLLGRIAKYNREEPGITVREVMERESK